MVTGLDSPSGLKEVKRLFVKLGEGMGFKVAVTKGLGGPWGTAEMHKRKS